MPLLTFKSDRAGGRAQSADEPPALLELNESRQAGSNLNVHVKNFIESSRGPNLRHFTLLKLNYNQQQQQQQQAFERSQTEPLAPPPPPQPPKTELKSVEVEVQKPLYDGYILAPDAVKDMLDVDIDAPFHSSAEAHYNATQHLRESDRKPSKKKTETRSTMTETKSLLQVFRDLLTLH